MCAAPHASDLGELVAKVNATVQLGRGVYESFLADAEEGGGGGLDWKRVLLALALLTLGVGAPPVQVRVGAFVKPRPTLHRPTRNATPDVPKCSAS